MSSRNRDRDYDRGSENYGRRSESDYGRSDFGRSYRDRSDRAFGYAGETEADKYTRELGSDRSRFWGDTSRDSDRSDRYRDRDRDQNRGREGYWGRGWENERNDRSRYGNPIGGSGAERGYNDSTSNDYSQRSSGYRSSENDYGQGSYGRSDSGQSSNYGQGQSRYGQGQSNYRQGSYGRSGSDYDRDQSERGEERGWWDRASDTVASWFGDEDAERRRQMDDQRAHRRGRGPKAYRRSDERIRDDIYDRMNDDYYIDASDIEVAVESTEVTLTGTVPTRNDKRRAEDIAENVSGVSNVENRLRVKPTGTSNTTDYSSTSSGLGTGTTSGTGTATGSSMGSTTPGTTASSAAAGSGSTTRSRGTSGD